MTTANRTIKLDTKAIFKDFASEEMTQEQMTLVSILYTEASNYEIAKREITSKCEYMKRTLAEIESGQMAWLNCATLGQEIQDEIVKRDNAKRTFELICKLNKLEIINE